MLMGEALEGWPSRYKIGPPPSMLYKSVTRKVWKAPSEGASFAVSSNDGGPGVLWGFARNIVARG